MMSTSMMELTTEERRLLLQIARRAIEMAVMERSITPPELTDLPEALREDGASFVTLTTRDGSLRGCIGALEAGKPLALDVFEHAIAAATEDYRFLPVSPEEVPDLRIEISRLTKPQPLDYTDPSLLPILLHPSVDGVVLRDGFSRATFLPQVWEKLPDPSDFLSHLCRKMGAPSDLWLRKKLRVEIYRVEEFQEYE